ncbi:MAG: NAD(P)-dependent oxidoreductase [Acidobacteriota bacterium]
MPLNKVISTGLLAQWAVEEISRDYRLVVLQDPSEEELTSALQDDEVVALIARSNKRITARLIDTPPNLKVIARTGVGYDSIDVEAASRRGVPVLYTPGVLTRAVAEHAVALILAAAKDLKGWHQRTLAGAWGERDIQLNRDLESSVLGIIGFGRIGREVWRLLRSFDMIGLVNDPYLDPAGFTQACVRFVSLPELLNSSDIVTLHVPLNNETRGLINRGNIDEFKPGTVLINTARGEVIENQDILYEALERGRLEQVMIDTPLIEPPLPSDRLLHHPRALFTPHNAGRTPRCQEKVLRTMLHDLKAVLSGGQPRPGNVVNPEVLKSRLEA